jgi:hypothetical protein
MAFRNQALNDFQLAIKLYRGGKRPPWTWMSGSLTPRPQRWTFLPPWRLQCAGITMAYAPSVALRSAETPLNMAYWGARRTRRAQPIAEPVL